MNQQLYVWQKMPFIRLIIPLIAGIIIQFYLSLPLVGLMFAAAVSLSCLLFFSFLTPVKKFAFQWMQGVAINLAFMLLGTFLVLKNDITKSEGWIGNADASEGVLLVTIQEPLVEKAKSFKAEGIVTAILQHNKWTATKGRLLIYLSKDSVVPAVQYGSQLLFKKPLQRISNSGNPGNFNYVQYNAFKDIYHQVFLKRGEYVVLPVVHVNPFKQWLFKVRDKVILTLQKYIVNEREVGVAEALLIGYRDDLDKDLVQAYSNTGVVHIIAISGLHLGMIYGALVLMLKPFRKTRGIRWAKPVIILLVLWVFSFLAGGVPSILRSAVMFSFIIIGEAFNRQSSIYNTLASSAFVLLCINPYYLWDIGFQLSYIAVLSIVAFSGPLYRLVYIKSKPLDFVWKLTSVTLSAQVLTIPVIFYSFHQFPNYFLLTNCIIVPLSSIALFAELGIILFSMLPAVAAGIGKATTWIIWLMNEFIIKINQLPYAVYDGIQLSGGQTIMLFAIIIACSYFFMTRYKPAFFIALMALSFYVASTAVEKYEKNKQLFAVVYNIPKLQGIDFVDGRQYTFWGDSVLLQDGYERNFHLKPARTLFGTEPNLGPGRLMVQSPFVQFYDKKWALIDKTYTFYSPRKIALDVLVLSHNAKVKIADLAQTFDCAQYVIDGSNSMWKINGWKKECDSLHLQHHVTTEKGAFMLKIQ